MSPPQAPGHRPPVPLRLRQLLSRLFLLSGLIAVACALAGALAFVHQAGARNQVVDRIDPANLLVSGLLASYLDQETGVWGYAMSADADFLGQYQSGQAGAEEQVVQLSRLLSASSPAGRLLAVVRTRAGAWRDGFAVPAVQATGSAQRSYDSDPALEAGRALFNSLRSALAALQRELTAERRSALAELAAASDQLTTVMIVALAVIVVDGTVIWVALRRLVLRPLAELSVDARVVSDGALDHVVRRTGPLEIADLAGDIEQMRRRIFAEVAGARDAQSRLAEANAELARSNEDLEQFAYVASHDLQEPLRKVASFCQLLEQRYGDQLDERGTQYIAFAVDGAKRMQVLISDLLAFSRIGRTTERFVEVDLAHCLAAAETNLSGAIEASGATVSAAGPLPRVEGDPTLLTNLFQNLVANAVKFHGDAAPEVRVTATRTDEGWLIGVSDNGIGIEPRFAERIFVIFQRLHGREAYPGTGIGLAMCRKIVEFHGGRIWLDTEFSPGTRFCFTLPEMHPPDPAPEESDDEREPVDQAG